MSRRLPVTFRRLVKSRASDFDVAATDTYEEIGAGTPATEYKIGAQYRHLTDADKTQRGYSLSQDAIRLTMPYTPTLAELNNREHVALIEGVYWNVLEIDRFTFNDRKIRVIVGRNNT